ncbi:uncharacterized protein KGF55_000626 [Candida pseudojiufengensis]|uniref:uncharacterized protein n=1 Tax=Candida pseudojiufengensis TaxID=497109 RepID=UPI0022243DC9|nr:uncharacterized protein KGF55_000626 [Candida pseudojiufengensis]KAI5966317.1 hypothetical protein KGF55_000626 [Candida pseudojiufengensis]
MKLFDYNPDQFSKITYNIGGIDTHVYNANVLKPYIESFNTHELNHSIFEIPINVLYLLHQREGNYKYTEAIAYNILNKYYSKREGAQQDHQQSIPLICVTFDLRNHGSREINKFKNQDWVGGNKTHGSDMISSIMGNVKDLKLIIDFLPIYLNLDQYLTDDFKKGNINYKIKFENILSGYSLGAHTVFRFINEYPNLIKIINPVVGCIDLSSLLINRLKQNSIDSSDYDKKWFYYNYNELDLSPEQQEKYPLQLHNFLQSQDLNIFENFPMQKIKMFASFGKKDNLVPYKLNSIWCDLYLNTNDSTKIFIDDDLGHDVNEKMIDEFVNWLVENL